MLYTVSIGERSYRIDLERDGDQWNCRFNGGDKSLQVDARLIRPDVLSLLIAGRSYEIRRDQWNGQVRLWVANTPYFVELRDPRSLKDRSRSGSTNSPARLVASMPGKVLRVLVRKKQFVERGQALVVLEAMKMQNEIRSPSKGVVSEVVQEGIQVNAGDALATVDPE